MSTATIKWSDNDKNFGPLIYARDKHARLALVLGSGDEEYPGCRIRLSILGHTFILALPKIIVPWKIKRTASYWSAEDIKRMGRDWYWEIHEREYGFSYSEGFLQVFLGAQTMDSSTTQSRSCFLPWTQWKHVRRSLYGLQGEHFWTEPEVNWRLLDSKQNMEKHREIWAKEELCPTKTFSFSDFDGENLTATTKIEEREWHFGTGWFQWLRFFRKPKIRRYLDIRFSGETRERKGSWKGGTIGHSIEMNPGELHEPAFKRYCEEHRMTFLSTS